MSQSIKSIINLATTVATKAAASGGNERGTAEVVAAIESACDLLAQRAGNMPQLQALIDLSRKACQARGHAAQES